MTKKSGMKANKSGMHTDHNGRLFFLCEDLDPQPFYIFTDTRGSMEMACYVTMLAYVECYVANSYGNC